MEVYTVTFEFPHGKIPTKSWQLCFPFVFLALSISFLSPTEYFRNEIPPRSCLIRERNGPLCEKRVGGVDDTEGSMIEVRENVHERGKRKGRKVVERRDWRCIVRAAYLTETLRSCERREHIGEQQYPISLTIAGSIERNSSISRIEGFNLAQRTKRK